MPAFKERTEEGTCVKDSEEGGIKEMNEKPEKSNMEERFKQEGLLNQKDERSVRFAPWKGCVA